MSYNITPIGQIITPFHQKFGIPRQGIGLSKIKGEIQLHPHIDAELACQGIEQFSHLWILFLFHQNQDKGWSERVRPPRLGGNQKLGVFATRSSFRPNAIGMSVVKFINMQGSRIFVEGVDMLNNTPIIDIKPYINYADAVVDAHSGFAQSIPAPSLSVTYDAQAIEQLAQTSRKYPDLADVLQSLLSQDPRPAYKQRKADPKVYYLRIYDIDVAFSVHDSAVHVKSLREL